MNYNHTIEKMNIFSIVFISILIIFLVGLIIYSLNKPINNDSSAWNVNMTEGKKSAPNTLVEYTDIMCPHCADFYKAINNDTFKKKYIDSGKLYIEIRVVPILKDSGSENSESSAQSAYCAANQKKFYAYFNELINSLSRDYFNKGIGVSKTGPFIPKLDDSYYTSTAKTAGLSYNKMAECLSKNETSAEVDKACSKAINALSSGGGVPFFVINNKFTTSGFSGGYAIVEEMLKAGGVN
jgi:predicted DsbA family dithiol-disulfide isomerase